MGGLALSPDISLRSLRRVYRPKLLQGTAKEATKNLIAAGPTLARLDGSAATDWLASKACQIGKSRVYMREEVVRALEQPRLEATRNAAVALQRRQQGRQARAVCRVLRMHVRGVAGVRALLEVHDTDKAQDALEALEAEWAQVTLPLSLTLGEDAEPLLPPCREELKELTQELSVLEEVCLASLDPRHTSPQLVEPPQTQTAPRASSDTEPPLTRALPMVL